MTDPDHAWDTHEEEPTPVPVSNAIEASGTHIFYFDIITEVLRGSFVHNRINIICFSGGKDHIEYRAIYDFDSSNPDELPFKSGDIIIVSVH